MPSIQSYMFQQLPNLGGSSKLDLRFQSLATKPLALIPFLILLDWGELLGRRPLAWQRHNRGLQRIAS